LRSAQLVSEVDLKSGIETKSCHFKQADLITNSGEYFEDIKCYPNGGSCKVVCDAEETVRKIMIKPKCSVNNDLLNFINIDLFIS